MTPSRSVLSSWRALEAAERVRAEFDRHLGDVEALSATVRSECHRLDGDGWQGAAFDAVLSTVETVHRHNRVLCDRAEGLRDAGVRALSDLHYTGLALLDYVADAEANGCAVAEDWTVTGEPPLVHHWAEIIAEASAAVDRAERRGWQAIVAAGRELRDLVTDVSLGLGFGLPATRDLDTPTRSGAFGGGDAAVARGNWAEHTGVPSFQDSAASGYPAVQDGRVPRTSGGAAAEAADAPELSMAGALPPTEGSGTIPVSESSAGHGTSPATAENAVTTPAGEGATTTDDIVGAARDSGIETASPAGVFTANAPTRLDPSGDVSAEQLVAIMPDLPLERARQYLPGLNAAMREGDITTSSRRAAFLAQLAHESGEFRYFEELGDDDYFHQYDPGQLNAAAGNTEPGDGPRYHGRGPIQLTGRANYRTAGQALGLDLEGTPELAAQPDVGFRIAQWYWTSRNINALADAGDFAAVTRAVNGGYNGLESREAYYRRALEALG
ncbi:glycoside hydrolase family 19 protein [Nocardia alni]|uniref:glycoside hydrolase family 19 protein n=1 Tax=Nocardia alni TaxID=2815723 RepID=UPI001C23AAED|nr:glycoside hydrolase family 19 protein [Nocardia alni]